MSEQKECRLEDLPLPPGEILLGAVPMSLRLTLRQLYKAAAIAGLCANPALVENIRQARNAGAESDAAVVNGWAETMAAVAAGAVPVEEEATDEQASEG